MVTTKVTALLSAFFVSSAIAVGTSDSMGPAGFLWPPDREWSDEHDNSAPCGSDAQVGERTTFPICE